MDLICRVVRILLGALFVMAALGHLGQTESMAQCATSRGVPMATLATRVTGVQVALLMNGFWKETEPMAKQMEMVQFNKDVGLTLTGPLLGL